VGVWDKPNKGACVKEGKDLIKTKGYNMDEPKKKERKKLNTYQ
jgi:hypothetical protein